MMASAIFCWSLAGAVLILGTLWYLAHAMTPRGVLCDMAPPIDFDALYAELAKRGGLRIRWQRHRSQKALRLALKRWPPQPEAFAIADLRESLTQRVEADYRVTLMGVMPSLIVMLISFIVRLLVEWWLEDRHARNQQLCLLRDSLV